MSEIRDITATRHPKCIAVAVGCQSGELSPLEATLLRDKLTEALAAPPVRTGFWLSTMPLGGVTRWYIGETLPQLTHSSVLRLNEQPYGPANFSVSYFEKYTRSIIWGTF